ncbi:F-box domain containing protein [Pandoravirus salinus]|uniref:F-box domain containing protein n=1 Tax=Pandoravirus salinus TaxID=1349410 RepID=S4VVL5_9VIRU|nr:F-box domain [Pandoravirus salinus]AGO84679.1 F-box domain containing protein [Pandoravirus salinus]
METARFDALPDEMACAVLQWLPPLWRWLASFVSRRWRQCAETVGPRVLILQGARTIHNIPFFGNEAAATIGALLMDEAAGTGHTSVVLWLRRHLGIGWTVNTVRKAALGGRKHTIDCMRDQRALPLPVDRSCLLAALIGRPGIRFARTVVHGAGQPWTPAAMAVAVALGERRTVSALHHAGCPHNDLAVVLAIVCGRRDLLSAMAATCDEVAHAATALSHTPYCRQADASGRYASVVCDAAVLGIRGRHLAESILNAHSDCTPGIQSCRHHRRAMWGVAAFSIIDFDRVLSPWDLIDDDTEHGVVHDVGLCSRQSARDHAETHAMLGADPTLRGPHDRAIDWRLTPHECALERIAKSMRDGESRARRRTPPAVVRQRAPPKDRHRARNR